jgi:branched-chain amino acid transport system substrate-binding protein
VSGAQAYLRKIKAAGGVNGHKVEWVVNDSQTNPQAAVAAVQSAISAGNIGIIHAGGSAEFPAVKDLITQAGLQYFMYSVPDSALYPTPTPGVFMFSPSATQQANATLAEAKDQVGGSLSGKRIAFVGLSSPYIDGMLATIKEQAQKAGADLVDTERFTIPLASFASQAAKIIAAKPDVVINAGTVSDAPTTAKAMITAGLTVPIIYYSAGSDSAVLKQVGTKQYIALRAATVPVSGTTIYQEAQAQGFATQAEGSAYFSIGWAMAATMVEGMRRCGNACTSDKLGKSLEGISNFNVPADVYFGLVTFSATRHTAISAGQFYTWDPVAGSETKVGKPVAV